MSGIDKFDEEARKILPYCPEPTERLKCQTGNPCETHFNVAAFGRRCAEEAREEVLEEVLAICDEYTFGNIGMTIDRIRALKREAARRGRREE